MGCCATKAEKEEEACLRTPPSPTLPTAVPSPALPPAKVPTPSSSPPVPSRSASPPSPWNSPAQPAYIDPPCTHSNVDPPLPMPIFHDTCPIGYVSDSSTAMAEPPSPGSERGEVAWTPPCSTLASFVSSTATTTASLPPAAMQDANESDLPPAPDAAPALNPLLASHGIDIVIESRDDSFLDGNQEEESAPPSNSSVLS